MTQDSDSLAIKYAVAIAFVVLLGLVAYLVVIAERPQWDKLIVVGGLIGAVGPMTFSLLAFLKGEETRQQSMRTFAQVNGRVDEFKAAMKKETERMVQESFVAGMKHGLVTLQSGGGAPAGAAGPQGEQGPRGEKGDPGAASSF